MCSCCGPNPAEGSTTTTHILSTLNLPKNAIVIVAENRRRYLVCQGEVLAADGRLLARAEGKFFPVPPETQARMEGRWRRDAAGAGTPPAP